MLAFEEVLGRSANAAAGIVHRIIEESTATSEPTPTRLLVGSPLLRPIYHRSSSHRVPSMSSPGNVGIDISRLSHCRTPFGFQSCEPGDERGRCEISSHIARRIKNVRQCEYSYQ
jgi:hypothetical protein